jgi:hypothetical protein
MFNKKQPIYHNHEYIKILYEALNNTKFNLPILNQELTDDYIKYGYNQLRALIEENPNDEILKKTVTFFEKSYLLFSSGEYLIFNYYSEFYEKDYLLYWDSEWSLRLFKADIVNIFEEYPFDMFMFKEESQRYIKKCIAIGLKYSPLIPYETDDEIMNDVKNDIYLKSALIYLGH